MQSRSVQRQFTESGGCSESRMRRRAAFRALLECSCVQQRRAKSPKTKGIAGRPARRYRALFWLHPRLREGVARVCTLKA